MTASHAETPPSAQPSRLPLLLACGGSFLAFVDVTITNLAVPDLARDFGGVELESLSWVVTLYTILFAALLAPAGRMADVLGRRRLFAIGVIIFTAASLLAAIAPTFGLLLAARSVQGAGAAALLPASLAFVLADTPAPRRAAAIGLWSAAASAAAALGPVLGGVLVETFGWRSLFIINLPAGALLALLALRAPTAVRAEARPPDIVGTFILTGGLALLVLGIAEGETWGWTETQTLACLLAGPLALAAAIVRSAHHPVPAIDTGLWRSRTYLSANLVSVLFGAALYATLLLGVLFLTDVWHYSALQAGLAMSPGAIASAAVGISVGRATHKPSARFLTTGGALMIAGISAGLALWLPAEPHFLTVWLPAGIITGVGMGAVSVGVSTAASLCVAPQSFAAATGLNVAARQVGGALGVAALAVLIAGPGADDGVTPFANVYIMCALACAAAALIGTRLVVTQPARSPTAARGATIPARPA